MSKKHVDQPWDDMLHVITYKTRLPLACRFIRTILEKAGTGDNWEYAGAANAYMNGKVKYAKHFLFNVKKLRIKDGERIRAWMNTLQGVEPRDPDGWDVK